MTSFSAYVDESYNSKVFCVGGWVGPDPMWSRIESSWNNRIEHEGRISIKRGFLPVSRYHATDCANLKNEFDESNGWDIDRQIKLSKKLCGIIASVAPYGIVQGGVVEGLTKHWPDDNFREALYYISFGMFLISLGQKMQEGYPDDKVTVFYDRSKQLGAIAQATFNKFKNEEATKDLSRFFVTCAPMDWENCTALQPADLLAYEGMKRINQKLSGKAELRKSFQAILGKRTPIEIGWATEKNLEELRQLAQARKILPS